MFAIRLRVSPCRARCSPRSVGRVTRIWPSSCLTSMSRATRSASWPFGPLTRTSSGSTSISTPSGTSIGCLPMRLIACLPDPRDQLAADPRAVRVVAGHHAAGGGDDRRAHAAEDPGDVLRIHIAAPAGLREALEPGDHGLAVLRVLQPHVQLLADARGLDRPGLDVALLGQDARDLR